MEADTEETTWEALDTTALAAAETFEAMLLAAAPAVRRAAERAPIRGKLMARRRRCAFGALGRGLMGIITGG